MERAALYLLLYLAGFPQESDAQRFGLMSRNEIRELLNFNWAYQQELKKIQQIYGNYETPALQEAAQLYRAWDSLDDALYGGHSDQRLNGLNRLKKIIGPEAYNAGKMPPAVPLWRFKAIR